MSRKSIDYEVPSCVETEITGYYGAASTTIRNATFRVEYYRAGIMLYKDGNKLREVPNDAAKKLIQWGREFFAASIARDRQFIYRS